MAGYGDNQGFRDYASTAGYTIPAATTDADIATARQRAALAIDRYEPRFSGTRTGGFAQERAWPRTGAETHRCEPIPPDVIPQAIIGASYEAAFIELTSPGSLLPVVTASQRVQKETIGPISVDYAPLSASAPADVVALSTPVVTTIEALVSPFLYACLPAVMAV